MPIRSVPGRVVLLLLASAVLGAVPARAQRTAGVFGGEITVTATGVEEAAAEVPASVTVFTREELDDAQADTVADVLRRTPGVAVVRTGDEGKVASVFTRGTDSDHTLVMLDGVRLNSPYFGGFDWGLLPTAGLERVEVARGPYSALWGADAVGGVVSLVPSRGGDGLGAAVVAEGGQDDWQRFEGSVGWGGAGFDVYASGFDRQGRGELDNSDFDARQVLADIGYTWARGSRIGVLFQTLESDTGIPFVDPLTPTPNRRQRSEQELVAVPVSWTVSDDWSLQAQAARVQRLFRFSDPDDPWGYTAAETKAGSTQARLTSHHTLDRHQLTVGGEWREDQVDDRSSFGVNLDGETTVVSSLFVQDVWRAGRASVIVGARWDDADQWGSELSPRFDLGWSVSRAVELRVGYGEAFRQPSVGELHFPYMGNPELRPETSASSEVGVVWWAVDGTAHLELNLFSTEVDNLIEYDFATLSFANVSSASMRGVELAWGAALGAATRLAFQTTWLDTEDDAGNRLLRRPEWSGSCTLAGRLLPNLRGDLTFVWVGSRSDVDPVSFATIELGSHVTGNLALAYELWQGLEVTLRVLNITEADYQEAAGYPSPHRRIMGGLRWRL